MANNNFVVQNGLTVGSLTIFAGNGDVTTSGNIGVTGSGSFGGLNPQQIYNGTTNVTATSSLVNVAISGSNIASINSSGLTLTPQLTSTAVTANAGTLNVGGNINYGPDYGLIGSFVANIPNYAYVAVQNLNTGGNASTSFTAYNNTGTSYIDVGVNSSNFNAVSSGFVNNALNTANASYAYSYGGDMVVGTWNNNGIHFITNAVTTAGDSMFIAGNGNVYISGNLTVSGNTTQIYTTTTFLTETANLVQTSYLQGNVSTNNGNITITGNLIPAANLSYNIGSPSAWYNSFYGTSSHALYADLAENYQADKYYNPGTVLMFGGDAEVTVADADTTRVAGIVSTNPAHLMNGGLQGPNIVPLALMGRVPCMVIGPVAKGDLMVSAGFGYAKANNTAGVGQVIGKALADYPILAKGVIEVVVGRV
jgi:hypothetical protein